MLSSHEKEVDIRIRQNVFLIADNIFNKLNTNLTQVSSGSLAEGLDLPGSDIDVMFVLNGVKVIQNVQYVNRSARCTTLLVEDDMKFSGFSTLKLIAEGDKEYIYTTPECFVETINGLFLSNISFVSQLLKGLLILRAPYMVLVCQTNIRHWI